MTRPEPGPGQHDKQASPSWLLEPCPLWCTRSHEEEGHPEDRYHQSEPSIVPLIASPRRTVPLTVSLQTAELTIRIGRHVDDLLDWLAIEPIEEAEPSLVMTIESARLLRMHLDDQLRRHASD